MNGYTQNLVIKACHHPSIGIIYYLGE